MKVREAMRKKVISVCPGDGIVKVLRTFSEKKINGAPVIEEGELVGVITDSDIIANLDIHTPKIHFSSSPDFMLILAGLKSRRGMDEIEREMKVMRKFRVRDFMTREVFTVDPEDTVTQAACLMHKKKITRLPVVDGRGKLVGLLARQDIIRALTRC